MNDQTKFLTLLQVTVPPDTIVSVPSEIRVLELLGIVSNPDLVKAMQLTLGLIPQTTPATVKGLFDLLSRLIRLNPKSNKSHHDALDKQLAALEKIPDATLTYGTFLPICETLMKAAHKRHEHKG